MHDLTKQPKTWAEPPDTVICECCDARNPGGAEYCENCDAKIITGGSTELQVVIPELSVAITPREDHREAWTDVWITMASTVAKRATCPRKRVGAIVVKDNHLLSTGYNGAPHGLPHCEDVGCETDAHGHCSRSIHAEMNAIMGCTSSPKGGIMYVTHFPCQVCALLIVQAGIAEVVCAAPDRLSQRYAQSHATLRAGGVQVTTGR